MATSYTSLLGLALPVTGELAGTWGDTVNNAITSLLDTAVAGTTTLSTDADVTLTTTTGASNQARQAILLCSGARTALRTITAPAQSKIYVVINSTTGGYGVKLVGAGPTTGVTVAAGKTAVLVWNGSDFVEVAPATATTATNLAGGATGSVPYQSAASTTTFLSLGTAAQVLQVNAGATAPEWVSSTGTGNVVRATSPTLTTPTLGVASATTINKITLTAPATGSTLTIADGKTLTASNTLTFTGTDSSSVAFGTGGTVAYTSNNLSVFAATTSAQLAGVISDETGSGALVFGTSPTLATPTITTSATVPLLIGGTGTTSTLTLRSTSGVGTTGADIIFQTGNNGATEAMRVLNSGFVGIGTTTPTTYVQARKDQDAETALSVVNGNVSANAVATVQAASDSANAILIAYSSLFAGSGARTASSAALMTSGATTGGLSISARNAAGTIRFATGGDTERMRIDSSGNFLINTTTTAGILSVEGTNGVSVRRNSTSNGETPSYLTVGRSKGSTSGAVTALASGDWAGTLVFNGTDGTQYVSGARVSGIVDSTVSTGNVPMALVFGTNASGTGTPTERMRIDSAGNVGIGTASPANKLSVFVTDSSVYASTTSFVNPVRVENQSNTTGSGAGITFFSRNASAVSGAHILASVSTSSDNNNDFVIQQRTGPTTWAERLRLTSAGLLGLGTTAPVGLLQVDNDFSTASLFVTTKSSTGASPQWASRLNRGTIASPTAVQSGDILLRITGSGYGTTAYQGAAQIIGYAAETFSDTTAAGYLVFNTTPSGSVTPTERMRIDSVGNIGIGVTPAARLHLAGALSAAAWTTNGIGVRVAAATYTDSSTAASGTVASSGVHAIAQPTIASTNATVTYTDAATLYIANSPANGTNVTVTNPWAMWVAAGNARFDGNLLLKGATSALGYGTGSGGAVTQGTSRTQGVTLNKTNGAITLFSAAGSATYQTFTVTNSTVAATDTIIANQKSGTDKYIILVTAVAAGSFNITFATTGGTTTEQPVFNFAVIKAVAA
jgi:hypothetical protein